MLRLVAALAALSIAPAAVAQQKADPAAAKAEAEVMIAKAKAGEIFTPGAWEYGPTARHVRSGMTCRFALAQSFNSVTVFDPVPGRGYDVGCSAMMGGALTSHFASRAALVGSYEDIAETAIKAFDQRVGASAPYTGKVFELEAAVLPPMRVHRRVVELSGRKLYERIAVADLGDWIVTQRITAPIDAAPSADRMATMGLALMAKEMQAAAKASDRN